MKKIKNNFRKESKVGDPSVLPQHKDKGNILDGTTKKGMPPSFLQSLSFFPKKKRPETPFPFAKGQFSQRKESVHHQLLRFSKFSSHFGRKSRHLDFAFPWHASMCDNFLGVRNKVPHINTEQTLQCLVQAFYSIALVLRKGGKVLIVNKNSEFSPLFYLNTGVFSLEKTPHPKSPFVDHKGQTKPATAPLKWVGGCLTNWKEISKSMATLLYFSKRFGRFIKQNNIHFPRFKKMRNSFQGFINVEKEQLLLKERPQLLFLFNANESQQILNEARALQIPVVALADSSTDLSQITYPIPVNSDSVYLVHNCLSQLIQITERQGGFSK